MSADLSIKKANFINNVIFSVTQLLQIAGEFRVERTEWDSEGYGTGGANQIVDADFQVTPSDLTRSNKHLVAADLVAAIVSIQAITDLLAANGNAHYGNLFKLKR
jgi:hypothetical protein